MSSRWSNRPESAGDEPAGVYVSALDLFSIGVGPSSSHTVGPMRAASAFRASIVTSGMPTRFSVVLKGSLAATGMGHGTPDAVIAGLRGLEPETIDPKVMHGEWASAQVGHRLDLGGVQFDKSDLEFDLSRDELPHPNTMTFRAWDGSVLRAESTYLSVGGGFIERVGEVTEPPARSLVSTYRTAARLLEEARDRSIADVAWADEVAQHGAQGAHDGIQGIWRAMDASITRGLTDDGVLPGGLRVQRRAAAAWRTLRARASDDPAESLSIYAMAVNEENAMGHRVVTAPTNGAAGVLPAVLRYALHDREDESLIRNFLLTATAIGSLIKANASISGAVGGCQAEVGSACAMAAAGLTAVRGGTPEQVENAAEIALEHHLGLTCDPVGGLVQIPCIERNAVAAATALTASRLALLGDGTHVVSLDTVIEVMRQTGSDMSDRYKETSTAGLAVNVVEC